MVAERRAKPVKKTVKFRSQRPYLKTVMESNGVTMTTVTELPAAYESRQEDEVMTRPVEPVTPLMLACQQENDQEVRRILSAQPAAARDRDRTRKTALHYCADSSGTSCAELLLSAASDLHSAADEDGYTPLHLAVISGNRALVKLLLRRGADVSAQDHERHSAIHWATVCGELDIMDILLDAGANPSTADIHGAYPIHYAAQMCGPNSEMATDVQLGLLALKKLIAHGVDVTVRDHDGRQALLWAASAETRPSKIYCPSGSPDALVALVNAGAAVSAEDKDGLSALHCAASRGHTDCIDTLITLCGAEVDVTDSNGCTPLFYAVTLGHADCTELLLKCGAEPNRQDRKGRTPAHCGAAKGQIETVRMLGRHNANLWMRNAKGDQPLHESVQSGRKELVTWLLHHRPEAVNNPNNDGRCPLHVAAINNNIEMCKVLMDLHAHVNPVMRSSKGQLMTPLDSALYRGNRGCAKYLQLHGGVPASTLTDKDTMMKALSHSALSESQTQSAFVLSPETYLNLNLSSDGLHSSLSSYLRSGPSTFTTTPVEDGVQTDRQHTEHAGVQVAMPGLHQRSRSTDDAAWWQDQRSERRGRRPADDTPDSGREDSERRHRRDRRVVRDEDVEDVHNVEVVRRRLRRELNTRYVDEQYDSGPEGRERRHYSDDGRRRRHSGSSGDERRTDRHHRNRRGHDDRQDVDGARYRRHSGEERGSRRYQYSDDERGSRRREYDGDQRSQRQRYDHSGDERSSRRYDDIENDRRTRRRYDHSGDERGSRRKHYSDDERGSRRREYDDDRRTHRRRGADVDDHNAREEYDGDERSTRRKRDNRRHEPNSRYSDDYSEGDDEVGHTRRSHSEDPRGTRGSRGPSRNGDSDPRRRRPRRQAASDPPDHRRPRELNETEEKDASDPDEPSRGSSERRRRRRRRRQRASGSDPVSSDGEDGTEQRGTRTGTERRRRRQAGHRAAAGDGSRAPHSDGDSPARADSGIASVERGGQPRSDNDAPPPRHARQGFASDGEQPGADSQGAAPATDGRPLRSDVAKAAVASKLGEAAINSQGGKLSEKGVGKSNIIHPSQGDGPGDGQNPAARNVVRGGPRPLAEILPSSADTSSHPTPRASGIRPSQNGVPKLKRVRSAKDFKQMQRVPKLEQDLGSLSKAQQNKLADGMKDADAAANEQALRVQAEKKIFQDLLELKRVQMRVNKTNEEAFIKRLAENFNASVIKLSLKSFKGPYTYAAYEEYLNTQLKHLQVPAKRRAAKARRAEELARVKRSLQRAKDSVKDEELRAALQAGQGCHHASHAYTGIPCVAYITKNNHHGAAKAPTKTILPKINPSTQLPEPVDLRSYDPSKPLRLELNHGGQKQALELPTQLLDKNRKYQVSFSIRPTDGATAEGGAEKPPGAATNERGAFSDGEAAARTERQEQTGGSAPGDPDRHTHAKSL
ncbi:uncharacterized protein LOC122365605 isoform X3 [Amphibalanus amphitrite]|uniref:uncharacterized protein LOC122365605 isoform X3 n=1 Tax=Amphibalanus amphitrite TaxID=1232801 RepID=UPI001C91E246|nr:uncharacterized protein LOC122365605 isoform X3 [Amphibalanus amphitrite]